MDWCAFIPLHHGYKGYIYIGTTNFLVDCSMYKSSDGVNFELLLDKGNTSSSNTYIWSMQDYKGRLYVGTFTDFLGFLR